LPLIRENITWETCHKKEIQWNYMKKTAFRNITPCNLAEVTNVSEAHCAVSQKAVISIHAAVRT
jgi:hypothetical protein